MTSVTNANHPAKRFSADDWDRIRLVVFDVDGTLYEQRPVRLQMACRLAIHSLRRGSARDLRALQLFRRIREAAGDRALVDFEPAVLAETAAACGYDAQALAGLVEDWIERRPLAAVGRARTTGVDVLFRALRASGRRVAVWSDHRVEDKLKALRLNADDWVSAPDPNLRRLKPDPAGLRLLMGRAGVDERQTLMIGDRADRDGEAAHRAGTAALIKGGRGVHEFATFRRYDDPVFAPILSSVATA